MKGLGGASPVVAVVDRMWRTSILARELDMRLPGNHGSSIYRSLLMMLLLGLVGPLCAQKVEIRPLSGKSFQARFLGLSDAGEMEFQRGGKKVSVPLSGIISATWSELRLEPTKGSVRLELVDGDVFFGRIEGGNFDNLRLHSTATGSFTIFLDPIRQITMGGLDVATLPKPVSRGLDDELFMHRDDAMDRLLGEVQRLQRDGLIFSSDAGKDRLFRFREDRVAALRLADPVPSKKSPGLKVRLTLKDGGTLTGTLLDGDAAVLRLDLIWGPEIKVDLDQVRKLEVRGGRFFVLCDVPPESHEHVPFLESGEGIGVLRNKGFHGRDDLLIGQKSWANGIGMQARTTATWDVAGEYKSFNAMIGADPGTALRRLPGSAVIRVLGDGKTLFESDPLQSGAEAVPIQVDITGVKKLSLVVDFGNSGMAGALGVIADPILTQ